MIRKILITIIALAGLASAQNYTAVTATNIVDSSGNKISSGRFCFLATDQFDLAMSFRVGGGGQTVNGPVCTSVINGAIGAFQVANPANTAPANILYRVTVSSQTQGSLTYSKVAFVGATFDFDNYVPSLGPVPSPLPSFQGFATGTLNVISSAKFSFLAGQGNQCLHVDNTGTLAPAGSDCTTSAGLVNSVFTRTGAVAALAGDYVSTQLGDFSGTPPNTSGKIPIYDMTAPNAAGGTGAYVPGDPLVQGVFPVASSSEPNPVLGAVWDGAALRALLGDSAGRQTINVNGTVSVSATALPLPAGASIAAKQAAPGVAGTPSADVLTVQGATSMTPLKTDGSAVTQPISGTVTVQQGIAANLKVDISGTAANATAIKVDGSAVTQPVNVNNVPHVVCDSGCTPGGSTADNSAFTFGTTTLNPMGAVVDDVATNTVSENSIATPRMNTNRVLYMDLSKTVANATAIKVDGSAVTQPVSGTVTANYANPDVIVSGSLSSATSSSSIAVTGKKGIAVTVSGTFVANFVVQTSSDNTASWKTVSSAPQGGTNYGTTWSVGDTYYFEDVAGVTNARLLITGYTSGTLNYALSATDAGAYSLRKVDLISINRNTIAAGAGVSGTGVMRVALASDAAIVQQGTANTLTNAWPAKVTDGTNTMPTMDAAVRAGFHKVTDGTNVATVKPASTAAAATDPALVVAVSPNNTVKVDGSAVTQPVSGTVTANIGTTNGLALDATLTGGTQKAIVRGGAKGTTSAADVTSTAAGVNNQTLDVGVLDASGNRMPSGDAAARAVFHKVTDGTNVATVKPASTAAATTDPALVVAVSPNNTVKVDGSAVTQPVSGTVTSNQGTANTAANAWPHKITDGTNIAAVKPASTAALATDPALVVAISPNGGLVLGAGSSTIGSVKVTDGTNTAAVIGSFTQPSRASNSLTVSAGPNSILGNQTIGSGGTVWTSATTAGTTLDLFTTDNYSTVTFEIATSGCSGGTGLINFQGAPDSGAAVPVYATRIDTATPTLDSSANPAVANSSRLWRASVAGLSLFQLSLATTLSVGCSVNLYMNADTSSVGTLVGVNQVVPGTGATNEGKAEDAVAGNGDTGVFALTVRNDGGSTQPTSTNGDYQQVSTDAYGAVWLRQGHPNQISCTADNIAATLTQLTGCGAPGAGLSIYVSDIIVVSTTTTAGSFQLRTGTGSNCGTGTAAFYPPVSTSRTAIAPASTANPLDLQFLTPMKVAANSQLCVIGVATNTTNILVQGFIAP